MDSWGILESLNPVSALLSLCRGSISAALAAGHSAQTTPGPCLSPGWSQTLAGPGPRAQKTHPLLIFTDQKRALTEASRKCPLAETHMNSSGKLQFYREKAPDCHEPLLSQESKKSKKRAFEESEQEQSSPQSAKQKCVCLAVEDWDLLNSYWLTHTVDTPSPQHMRCGGLLVIFFWFGFTFGISIASRYFYFCGGGGKAMDVCNNF